MKKPSQKGSFKKGILIVTKTPIRAKDSHKSEMISELLFGECFTILEDKNEWIYIQNTYDKYEGYIEKQQCQYISETFFQKIQAKDTNLTSTKSHLLEIHKNNLVKLEIGSILPLWEKGNFFIENDRYKFPLPQEKEDKIINRIISFSKKYLGSPYLWGGRSISGIDCSGFVQAVFRYVDIFLERDAYQQAEQGSDVFLIKEAQAGDLAFFDNDEGKITHVGLLLNNNEIIHASGKVRIDKIDHNGIFKRETQQYSHKLRLIKRHL
ncbi:MAG: NlpC/P60 family protein [Bacteroidales bacterium]